MKCNGLFGVHRFEARFDLSAGDPAKVSPDMTLLAWGSNLPRIVESTRVKTYVRDVCVKCGATIERNPS